MEFTGTRSKFVSRDIRKLRINFGAFFQIVTISALNNLTTSEKCRTAQNGMERNRVEQDRAELNREGNRIKWNEIEWNGIKNRTKLNRIGQNKLNKKRKQGI